MLFNSFSFWLFFAVVAAVHCLLPHRGRNLLLLAASYFFYACWDWRFLSLILTTTVVDFFASRSIARAAPDDPIRKRWLMISLTVNLGILGTFKYFGFFANELDRLLQALGGEPLSLPLHLILPVGISFYTFQALSYTIDVFRGQTQAAKRFSDFALYIAFFPQLVAGPIERSSHLLPQVVNPRPSCDEKRFRDGFFLVVSGLFLKVVIADNMAWLVAYPFSPHAVSQMSAPDVLLGVYAFALQIYGDFAGYSAIAIGVSKWLGFDLMTNFRRPYFALDPRDFWRRWHISLSTWLRDYLYIFALGGNRAGRWRTARNLFLTMLLGGLWHGAAWTFVIWGALHGLWLVIHRFWSLRRESSPGGKHHGGWILKLGAWLVTIHLVCLGWLFFRAQSFEQAWQMLSLFGAPWKWSDYAATCASLILFFAGPWMLFEAWQESNKDRLVLTDVSWPWRLGLYLYVLLMVVFFPSPVAVEFIYFQF